MIEDITNGKRPMIVQDVLKNENDVLYISGTLLQSDDGESQCETWRVFVKCGENVGVYHMAYDFMIDDGWHRHFMALTPRECGIIGGAVE